MNLIVCGGSGLWAEKNHYPSILAMKDKGYDVRVRAICDPIDPYQPQKNEKRAGLQRIIELDQPQWIDPSQKSSEGLEKVLDGILAQYPKSALVVSTNPVYHYAYCRWGLQNNVPIVCDKPLVTARNSAFDPAQAASIHAQYDELFELFMRNRQVNSQYLFCSPLRRRALTPFLEVAKGLQQVYEQTGEGIRYMNVILNGGIHKYPAEYVKGGAHGHLDGIGTLAHSSYHYIDVIAWFLTLAPGRATKISVSVPYVHRVREYLATAGYQKLRELIEDGVRDPYDDISIPEAVLNSELDFMVCLKLLDDNDNTVGHINYTVTYSGFAPRLVQYDPEVTEYAHDQKGGRMSSIYFDIHQGALQQWQIIKNDEVAQGHNLELRRYVHPKLPFKPMQRVYRDTYESATLTSKDLFQYFVKSCLNEEIPSEQLTYLSTLETQGLTHRLYATMYEKIAENFYNTLHPGAPIVRENVIHLKQFLRYEEV